MNSTTTVLAELYAVEVTSQVPILPRRVGERASGCSAQSLAAYLQPITGVKQAVRFCAQVGEVRIDSLLLTVQVGWQPFPMEIANLLPSLTVTDTCV